MFVYDWVPEVTPQYQWGNWKIDSPSTPKSAFCVGSELIFGVGSEFLVLGVRWCWKWVDFWCWKWVVNPICRLVFGTPFFFMTFPLYTCIATFCCSQPMLRTSHQYPHYASACFYWLLKVNLNKVCIWTTHIIFIFSSPFSHHFRPLCHAELRPPLPLPSVAPCDVGSFSDSGAGAGAGAGAERAAAGWMRG